MKKFFIHSLFLIELICCFANAQINSMNGEFRYQHQYQDTKTGDIKSKFNRYSPQFILGFGGYLYSHRLISYNIQTSFYLNYINSYYQNITHKNKSFLFNYYNINVTALQNYLFRLDMFARDGELESNTNIVQFGESKYNFRQQQQRIQISSNKISFLPTTNIYFLNSHTWSTTPLSQANQLQREVGLNMSQSTNKSTLSLSGNYYDIYEKSTMHRDIYYRLNLNGSNKYSEQSRFDLNAEYYNHRNYSYTSSSMMFYNQVSPKINLSTSFLGRHMQSISSSAIHIGLNQAIQYFYSQNLQFNYLVFTNRSDDKYYYENNRDDIRKMSLNNLGNTFGTQYMFTIGNVDVSNGVNVGYSKQFGTEKQSNINAGYINSTNFRFENLNINTNLGFNKSKIYYTHERDETYKSASLSASTNLFKTLNSETIIDYRDEDIVSKKEISRKLRQFRINQRFLTSIYYYIPISFSFSGNINWNIGKYTSKFYGVNFTFNSSEFFIQRLSLGYSFNWSYDPLYRRDFINHESEINYQWRALSFQVRLREFRYIDKKQELWFTVARPF